MEDLKKHIIHWQDSAKNTLETAEVLFENKRYDACLFFGHLALEKMLKGLVLAVTKKAVPYTHDLERLAIFCELSLSEEKSQYLRTVTEFNISGRYHDIKADFYKKCDYEYTKKNFSIIKELYIWIKEQYPKM